MNLRTRGKSKFRWSDETWITCIFLAILVEGALRKWLLPAALHPFVYLAKDVLGICYIISHPRILPRSREKILQLIGYMSIGLLAVSFVLGMGHTWQSAVVTFKNATLWPLIAAAVAANTGKAGWRRLVTLAAISALGMAVLGGKQFFSPEGSWINRYAWTNAGVQSNVASFGGMQGVRATGTFSYISGMSEFAVFCFSLCFMQFLAATGIRERVFLVAGCGAAIVCAFESGSRAPMALIALVVLMSAFVGLRKAKTFFVVCGVGAVLVFAALTLVDKELLTEYARRWTRNPDETMGRIAGSNLRGDYWEMLKYDPVGIGLGQATGYAMFELSRTNQIQAVNAYDDGLSIIIDEAGILGLLAFSMALCFTLATMARGLVSRIPRVRTITGTLSVAPVYMLAGGIWHDHNATAFTWIQVAAWFFLVGEATRNGALDSRVARKQREPGFVQTAGRMSSRPVSK